MVYIKRDNVLTKSQDIFRKSRQLPPGDGCLVVNAVPLRGFGIDLTKSVNLPSLDGPPNPSEGLSASHHTKFLSISSCYYPLSYNCLKRPVFFSQLYLCSFPSSPRCQPTAPPIPTLTVEVRPSSKSLDTMSKRVNLFQRLN